LQETGLQELDIQILPVGTRTSFVPSICSQLTKEELLVKVFFLLYTFTDPAVSEEKRNLRKTQTLH
jgi:hypothetical protein